MNAQVFIKELKKGHGVNHPKFGYMQYRGLVTRHAFTTEPKIPHEYLFWLPADDKGVIKDKVFKDGQVIVEVLEFNPTT